MVLIRIRSFEVSGPWASWTWDRMLAVWVSLGLIYWGRSSLKRLLPMPFPQIVSFLSHFEGFPEQVKSCSTRQVGPHPSSLALFPSSQDSATSQTPFPHGDNGEFHQNWVQDHWELFYRWWFWRFWDLTVLHCWVTGGWSCSWSSDSSWFRRFHPMRKGCKYQGS